MTLLRRIYRQAGGQLSVRPTAREPSDDENYLTAIINEIRILLDFVTGSPARTLKDLVLEDPSAPSPTASSEPRLIKSAEILNRLNDLEQNILAGGSVTSAERTFLQILRDALGAFVRPASGLTIAYTAMVVGNQRGASRQTRTARAERAYENLVGPARRHRWGQRVLLAMALVFTLAAVYESARVALGRSILQSVQALHSQQATLSQEMVRLEQAEQQSPTPRSDGPKLVPALQVQPLIRVCDRPKVAAYNLRKQGLPVPMIDSTTEATLFETPAQQDICDRDTILVANFKVAHLGLERFDSDWASMIHPELAGPSSMLRRLNCWLDKKTGGHCRSRTAAPPDDGGADIDFRIAPVLLVLGNYVLPILFALLGATVYVILDFYSKIQNSLLSPRDNILSWIRLVLGMVLGACVGLFFTASDPAAVSSGAGLAASITLSASGLAFLAGFGVEGVFGLLDSLVRRVFSGDQDKGGRLTTG